MKKKELLINWDNFDMSRFYPIYKSIEEAEIKILLEELNRVVDSDVKQYFREKLIHQVSQLVLAKLADGYPPEMNFFKFIKLDEAINQVKVELQKWGIEITYNVRALIGKVLILEKKLA